MRKESVFKQLCAMVFALVLTLALAATVSAATITINGGNQAGLGGEQRFTAYQIFTGNLGSMSTTKELVGITWGDGVNKDALVKALKESDLPVADTSSTFGEEFTKAWNEWDSKHEDAISEAELVAQFLARHLTDPDYADDFARIVAGCTDDSKGIKSTKTSNGWQINVNVNGYYLVKDNYTSESASGYSDGAVSSYILEVLGTETVNIKSSIPTVTKKIKTKTAEVDGYLTETNQEVTFTLTGTVAQNISEYSTYAYKFTDTLSKGLTCDTQFTDANIMVTIDGTPLARGTNYTAKLAEGSEGTHILTVNIDDLIQAAESVKVTLKDSSKIVVTYKAKLNDSAVIGKAGNPNDVKLEYSNDPYGDGKGESVPDEVKTYTLGLDIVKQNDEEKPEPQEGVIFKLKNDKGEYAEMTAQSAPDDTTIYTIASWKAEEEDGTELVTDAKGTFHIRGLAEGKYTIVETKAFKDYEKMKDIIFDITKEINDAGALTMVELKRDDENLKREDVAFSGDILAGTGKLTLTNYRAPILPHTGGIGAKIVYIVSALAVLAGVCIVLAALKKSKSDKG